VTTGHRLDRDSAEPGRWSGERGEVGPAGYGRSGRVDGPDSDGMVRVWSYTADGCVESWRGDVQPLEIV